MVVAMVVAMGGCYGWLLIGACNSMVCLILIDSTPPTRYRLEQGRHLIFISAQIDNIIGCVEVVDPKIIDLF